MLPRSGIAQVLDHLRFSVEGKRVLELGPGLDAAPEWCASRGATVTIIDMDPVIAQYHAGPNVTAVIADYDGALLEAMAPDSCDLLWMKQSISASLWLDRAPMLTAMLRAFTLRVRAGGLVVVCPHWSHDGTVRLIDPASIEEAFDNAGYVRLPWIDGHNIEPMAPWTWVRRVV